MQAFKARQRGRAVLLLVLTLLVAASAQLVLSAASNSSLGTGAKCQSLTQCYLVALGPPQTRGEWFTTYISALHEHCAGLLQQAGAEECKDSVRCMYIPAPASPQGSSSNLRVASFLFNTNTSGNGMTPAEATYWHDVASKLQLQGEACLPIPAQLQTLRTRACVRRPLPTEPEAHIAPQQYLQHCQSNPAACFMPNSSHASDMASWWTGQAPQEMLEPSSSWKQGHRLQRAADVCTASTATQSRYVTDTCATRGAGRTPWNNSLTLSRLVVALMDAYESSSCNNTVTYSEALAVERIVKDLCAEVGCKATSAAWSIRSHPGLASVLAVALACAAMLLL